MVEFESIILPKLEEWFKSRVASFMIFLICIVIVVTILILTYKYVLKFEHKKMMLISIVSIVIALLLIFGLIISFKSTYNDYKKQAVIVVQNATIYCYEDNASFVDHYTDVKLTTETGEVLLLKLRSSHSLSYKKEYKGDFAYTEHSKELIWLDIFE